MIRCFKGNKHVGTLKEIYRMSINPAIGEEEVVRWCPNCGAVVVDLEIDGRVFPGRINKMYFPKSLTSRVQSDAHS